MAIELNTIDKVGSNSMIQSEEFKKELESLLNKYCIDDECETPDFILAEIIDGWLKAYKEGMKKNIEWHNSWKTLGESLGST